MNNSFPHIGITRKIISCAFEVHKALGPGLVESVYEEALSCEFNLRNIEFQRQETLKVYYKEKNVGLLRLDFLVEREVILEIKAAEGITDIFKAQLLAYLKAANKQVGLIINFNVPSLNEGIKRMVL